MSAGRVRFAGGTLPDGRVVDVLVEDGRIREVIDHVASVDDVDVSGRLLLPAGADAHAHLDKALSWDSIRPKMGDLEDAIASWRTFARTVTEQDIRERALREARALIAHGVTTVRTHVDVLPAGDPLRGIRALAAVREELVDSIDLEIVSLGNQDVPEDVYRATVDAGADLIGGAPHLADEPLAEIDRLVRIADAVGVGMDLHTDEALTGDQTLPYYARSVTDAHALHPERAYSAGHCVLQGMLPSEELEPTIDAVLAAGIGVVTLPITNLYLQGWHYPVATPRGLTALRRMIDRGVLIGAGADNVRDPFNPVGRSDFLETAMLLVVAGHLSATEAIDLSTNGSRRVMGRDEVHFEPGDPADFVAIRADNPLQAIAEGSLDRIVVHDGRVVAVTSVETSLAPADLVEAG